jgi:FtsP/CotA-like multicopper oxidase with cupredoxin domain
VQRDSLYGALIVHDPNDWIHQPGTTMYDQELLMLVGDWYHRPAQAVLDEFMAPLATGNEPVPSSLLVNGLGYFDCGNAVPAQPVDCQEVCKPWLQLDKTKRYRVRLLNVGYVTSAVKEQASLKAAAKPADVNV